MKPSFMRPLLAVFVFLLLSACGKSSDTAQQKQQPPPAEVTVVTVHKQSLPVTKELVGRLAPTRVAQVRARVTGIVLKRTYKEGTDVKQGQELFRLIPSRYRPRYIYRKQPLPRPRPMPPTPSKRQSVIAG